MGDQAGRGDVSCQQGDRREDLGEMVVEAIAGMGYGAGGGAEAAWQPGPRLHCAPESFHSLGKVPLTTLTPSVWLECEQEPM